METTSSLVKKTILVFVFLIMLLGQIFASGGIQTTFTVSGNNITVKMKSDISVSGTFTQFISDFRYLASDNPSFTVTSSNYSAVSVAENIPDPNNPLYRLQRFSFSGGTTSTSLAIGTEYTVFSFKITGGVGVGTIGLSMDDPTYVSNPDYTFNTGPYADYTDPFYGSLTNSDFTVSASESASGLDETWWWRTAMVNLGKSWLASAASTNWQTGSNWSDALVPTSTESITINPGANQPIAGAGSVCKDLYVLPGAFVNVAETGTLTVSGNLTIADNTALIVKSSVSGTGSLIVEGTVPAGNQVDVQRYIAGTNWANNFDGWHFLSSPVTSQAISGAFTPSASEYDFYSWDEPTQFWMNQKDGANAMTSFIPGTGYLVAYEAGGTKNFIGTLNNADVNTTLTHNFTIPNHYGYNLLGNPYSSALTWADANWTLTNIGPSSTQIWSNADQDYVVINPGDAIPAMNGFMVYTSEPSQALTIPKASRVHNATPWYKSGEQQIKLIAHDPQGSSNKASMIRFNTEATSGFDLAYDAYNLSGFAPKFYSVAGDGQFSVNTLTEASNNLVIPFGFVKNASSSFSIELAESIDGVNLSLRDKKTNTVVNLNQNPVYSFTSAEGDDANRFELLFGVQVGVNEPTALTAANVYSLDNRIIVKNVSGDTKMDIFTVQGQLLKNIEFISDGNHEIPVDLPSGIYMVRLSNGGAMKTMKVFVK